MKIALINENSQAAKNGIIYDALTSVTDKHGYQVFNYGMYGTEGESQLTYVQNGLLASILLTTKAADFVVTGCGTGVGAMLALNSFPGVTCGFASEPTEAYLFLKSMVVMPYPFLCQRFWLGSRVEFDLNI